MIRRYLKRAFLDIERRDDDGPGVLVGHAAVFYDDSGNTEFDAYGWYRERIMPEAFDEALARPDDVRALFNHDPNQVLGRTPETLQLSTDTLGLQFRIKLPNTALGRDLHTSVQRGDIRGASFAFEVTDETERKEEGEWIREIRGVKLYDVGPVTFPAYEATDVETNARSREDAQKWVEARGVVRPAGRSISMLRKRIEVARRQFG